MWSPAHTQADRQFWLKFLEKYKSFKFLWDADERARSNRLQRQAAYEELAEMTKAVTPEANVLFVKNRIASFRTCYRREIKKVKAAKSNGTTYKPSLFYFNALKFLDPDDVEDDDYNTTNWDTVSDNEDPFCSVTESKQPELVKSPVKKAKKEVIKTYQTIAEKSDDGEESVTSDTEPLPPPKRSRTDEYEMIGRRIAAHLRKMDDDQSLIAEKIISDVCFYGRIKALTFQSGLNSDVASIGRNQSTSKRSEEIESFYEEVEYT